MAIRTKRKTILFQDEQAIASKPEGKREPKWNPLFRIGRRKFFEDGSSVEFTEQLARTMEKNARKWLDGGHALQSNYHHFGGAVIKPQTPLENLIASGKILDVKVEGGWFKALFDWTPRAAAFIDSDELMYLSMEFAEDFFDKDTGKRQGPTLLGAALTNTPFLKELPRVAASDTQADEADAGAPHMDRKKLIAILCLSDTATEADIEKAIADLNAKATAGGASEATIKTLSDAKTAIGDQVKALSEQVTAKATENATLVKELSDLKTAAKAGEVETFITQMKTEGRITPAMEPSARKLLLSDFAMGKEVYAAAPKVVSTTEAGHSQPAPNVAEAAQASRKQYVALMDTAIATGLSPHEAAGRVNRENPELAKAVAFTA